MKDGEIKNRENVGHNQLLLSTGIPWTDVMEEYPFASGKKNIPYNSSSAGYIIWKVHIFISYMLYVPMTYVWAQNNLQKV